MCYAALSSSRSYSRDGSLKRPNTPPHHHYPYCHLLLSSVTFLFFVIHQQVRRKAGQSLVWVWETVISFSYLFQPVIAQPMSVFTLTQWIEQAKCLVGGSDISFLIWRTCIKKAVNTVYVPHLFSSHSQFSHFFRLYSHSLYMFMPSMFGFSMFDQSVIFHWKLIFQILFLLRDARSHRKHYHVYLYQV